MFSPYFFEKKGRGGGGSFQGEGRGEVYPPRPHPFIPSFTAKSAERDKASCHHLVFKNLVFF